MSINQCQNFWNLWNGSVLLLVLLFYLFLKSSACNLLLLIHINSCMDLINSYSHTHVLTNTKIPMCKRGLAWLQTCVCSMEAKGWWLSSSHRVSWVLLEQKWGMHFWFAFCALWQWMLSGVFSHYFVSLLISHRQNSWILQFSCFFMWTSDGSSLILFSCYLNCW